MNFKDQLNTESDKRKIQGLIDEGVISEEELANAPIYLVLPDCRCNQGLEEVGRDLRCPVCRKLGKQEKSNE